MQTYTAKPVKPVTVQAIQYVAPNGDDVAGNLDELKALADVREQTPWNPAGGQNYVSLVTDTGAQQLEPGGYLVFSVDGSIAAMTADAFTAAFDVVPDAKS